MFSYMVLINNFDLSDKIFINYFERQILD